MISHNHIEEIEEIERLFEEWGLSEHFNETVKDSLFLHQGGARVKGIEIGSDVFEVWVLRDPPGRPEPREFSIYIGLDGDEMIALSPDKFSTAATAWERALRAVVQMGIHS